MKMRQTTENTCVCKRSYLGTKLAHGPVYKHNEAKRWNNANILSKVKLKVGH